MSIPLLTNVVLAGLIGAAAVGAGLSLRALRRPAEGRRAGGPLACAGAAAALALGLLVWRAARTPGWRPLETHVDALLLVAAGLAGAIVFLLSKPRALPVAAGAFPVLALVLVLAICPTMTAQRTHEGAWLVLHLVAVLGGLALSALAAAVGAAWLYTQRRLKDRAHLHTHLQGVGRTLSLESLENALVALSTAGFLAFSAGLATGIVYGVQKQALHWGSPKVVASLCVWALYAVLMLVRHAPAVRGRRAAWLAILGLVLVAVAYALSLPAAGGGQG